MTTRTITIYIRDAGDFDVHEGERCTTRLCWDEMLGQIVTMTHPQITAPRYPLETMEEIEARRARWRKPDPNVVDAEIVTTDPDSPLLT